MTKTMQKTSIVATAIMAFVVFAGPASAQVPDGHDLTNLQGWWDHLSCTQRISVAAGLEINFYSGADREPTSTGEGTQTGDDDHGNKNRPPKTTTPHAKREIERWCRPWSRLNREVGLNDVGNIERLGIKGYVQHQHKAGQVRITRTPDEGMYTAEVWWDSFSKQGQHNSRPAGEVGRMLAIGDVDTQDGAADNYVAGDWSKLSRTEFTKVEKAFEALKQPGSSVAETPDEPEDAPALPLAATGLLGLMLAARGAWRSR